MEFVKLTEKEFKDFAYHHETASFHQTIGWGKLKAKNGWKYELIGLKDNKKVVAAAMMLSKNTPIKKKMFYAPHGFILDYNNFDVLDTFVKEVKKYVKDNGGIFFKIDPYVMMVQRDADGKVVEGGKDNTKIYKHLQELGFKEVNGKVTDQALQGKWLYILPLEGKSYDQIFNEMGAGTRRAIRKNEKYGVTVREGNSNDFNEFKKIMDHTSERREFLSRSESYYKNMYECLNEEGICRIFFTEINLKEQIEKASKELKEAKEEFEGNIKEKESGVCKINDKKFEAKQKELQDRIDSLTKNIKEYKEEQEKNGDVLTLGSVIYMIHGDEVISLVGGAYKEYMKYQSFYTMHDVMIKYACENGYKRYNFYGISGNLVESDPMYGIYLMKKGFGGEVLELLGEFDYPVNKPLYKLYKTSYAAVRKAKKIKTKIHK